MSDTALLTLTQWMSPAYPIGAFSYSHGLETAVTDGDISDFSSAKSWINACLTQGAGRNDAILLSCAYRADDIAEISDIAEALCASKERWIETMEQGRAFANTTSEISGLDIEPMPYPVAVGAAASAKNLPLDLTLTLYLQSFSANLVSAIVRYLPLGQTEGQKISAALHAPITALTHHAMTATLDDLGACTFRGDMAAMKHETQHTRLFKT